MNSIDLFAQNPEFRLKGSTSISSFGGAVVIFIIVMTSIFICYPFVDDIWSPYQDLYVEYSMIDGATQVLKGIEIGIITSQPSKVSISNANNSLPIATCNSIIQNAICFNIPQSDFQQPVEYSIETSLAITYFQIFIKVQNYLSPKHQKQEEYIYIPFSYNSIVNISLDKYIIQEDNSLFQFQPYTSLSGISDIHYNLTTSSSPIISLVFSQNPVPMFTFKRQKLSLICGKLITCLQFLFMITSMLFLTPYHKTKYKYEASRQTINDPVLSSVEFTTLKLIFLTLYCYLPSYLQKKLKCIFPRDIVYVCVFAIPLFDQRLSIDKLHFWDNQQYTISKKELKNMYPIRSIKQHFSYRLMLDNDLDDQQQDQEEIQRRLNMQGQKLQAVIGKQQLDIWYYLNMFDMSGIPIQFQYTPQQNSKQKSKQIVKQQKNKQEEQDTNILSKCYKNKYIFVVCGVLIFGLMFILFFLNDILQHFRDSQQIQTYTTLIQENTRLDLPLIKLISDNQFSLSYKILNNSNTKFTESIQPQCQLSSEDQKYICYLNISLSSNNQNNYQFQYVSIQFEGSSSVTLQLDTKQLIQYQIVDKILQYSMPPGLFVDIEIGIITQSRGYSNTQFISYPTNMAQLPLLSPNSSQLILRVDIFQRVRKITYNSFYTVIKSSWSIIRVIIVTMIFDVIINPIRKRNSTIQFINQHKNSNQDQNQKILDIVAIINFINTKIQKQKRAVDLSDSFQITINPMQ